MNLFNQKAVSHVEVSQISHSLKVNVSHFTEANHSYYFCEQFQVFASI